ncbi:extensin family protein [Azorhizobium caulinodans]|uniref:extensin-like domain-containing protein n=1 Tax=Azorhizobium caulinodans TaxID=7 RepID=UPI002FBE7AA3
MTRGVSWSFVAPLVCVGLLLTGCRFDMFQRREPWRAQAEEKCIAEGGVTPSVYIEPMRSIDGPGACGMEHPFKVAALNDGTVGIEPKATLACPMVREVDAWIAQVVQPAAMAWMGAPVVAIKQMSSYSCRGMNGQPGAKISEHAFGNALDVGGFRFANGVDISVKNGWKGPPEARGFLLQVQAGACEAFTTVLAPGSNIFHYDHIHVDLMRRNNPRLICKPKPQPLPAPPVLSVSAPEPGYPQQPAPQQPGGYERSPMQPLRVPQGQAEPMASPQVQGQPQEEAPAEEEANAPQEIAPQAAQPQQTPPRMGEPQPIQPQPGYGRAPTYGTPQVSAPPSSGYGQQGYGQQQGYARQGPQGYGQTAPQQTYQPQPAPYGAPQPGYDADSHQPVLLPPGSLPSQPRMPGPMSYATAGKAGAKPAAKGPFTEAGIVQRRYYAVPIPQPSPIPLPLAIPGED